MALTRGKNVPKNRKTLKASKSKDKDVTDEVKSATKEEDNYLSNSEDELSEGSSDIEELATESASEILSKLHVNTAKLTRVKDTKTSKLSSRYEPTLEKPEQQSCDDEVHFFIDSKPSTSRSGNERTSKLLITEETESGNESPEIEGGESDSESDDNDSISETSESGNHVTELEYEHGKRNVIKRHKSTKYVSSLRAHISDEIAKIAHGKKDRYYQQQFRCCFFF